MEPDGLTRWMSIYEMLPTMQRIRRTITRQGMTVFAEVDHGSAAAAVGLSLRPMRLLVFGNAAAGTRLMQTAPTVGIDLPLKALVWTDEEGGVWLAYNDPGWIAARHAARAGNDQTLAAIRAALAALAEAITQPDGGDAG
jgi:uncharacterized protein (DUF302 family)